MMRRLPWIALTLALLFPPRAFAQTYVNGRLDTLPGTSVVIASRSYPVFAIQFSGGGVATGDITNGLDVDVTRLPIAFNTGAASSTTVRTVSASDSPDVTALQIIDNAYAEVANDFVTARLSDGTNYLTVSQDATAGSAALATGPQIMGDCDDTATVAGVENAAARVRVDCTSRALYTRVLDPCSGFAKTHIAINISTATTTELTPSLAGASTNYYICSLNLVTAAANNVALTDDDSDGCGSVTSGLAGGTTAASGWNFSANGGMTFGNGMGTVFKTAGANRVVCLVTSAATQLSGSIEVVAAP